MYTHNTQQQPPVHSNTVALIQPTSRGSAPCVKRTRNNSSEAIPSPPTHRFHKCCARWRPSPREYTQCGLRLPRISSAKDRRCGQANLLVYQKASSKLRQMWTTTLDKRVRSSNFCSPSTMLGSTSICCHNATQCSQQLASLLSVDQRTSTKP